jgi:hypothetical protein
LGALPADVHVATPVEHEMAMAWQEPASLQSPPAAHAMHVPLSQTAPASHGTPSPALPTGMHVGCPDVEHVTTPVWHVPGVHVAPAWHAPGPPSV